VRACCALFLLFIRKVLHTMKRSLHHIKIEIKNDSPIYVSLTKEDIESSGGVKPLIHKILRPDLIEQIHIKHVDEKEWRKLDGYR
jgi:P pilus assembly chaperone PapD